MCLCGKKSKKIYFNIFLNKKLFKKVYYTAIINTSLGFFFKDRIGHAFSYWEKWVLPVPGLLGKGNIQDVINILKSIRDLRLC